MTKRSHNQQCPECGTANSLMPFANETRTIRAKGGASVDVPDLSGFRCRECGEEVLDEASAQAFATAGDALVRKAREDAAAQIKRVRLKLGLTQHAAAELTGGGHNAFSRYERGQTAPVPAVVNLFRLLDNHPELLRELRD